MSENNTRITVEMTIEEMLWKMSEGNPGALTCMLQMLEDSRSNLLNILLLDSLGIYGSKIYMLWNDSCGRDMDKFKETLKAFRRGEFSEKEIHDNLNQIHAKPFI